HGGLCENVIRDGVGLVAFEATTTTVQVVADTERDDGWGSQVVEQCGAASGTSSPTGEVTRWSNATPPSLFFPLSSPT
ncbi:hypothetical protein A2U01_0092773, partial [Trifolium medium]|nr:hypothetical protein [Trifolium medium]